MMNPVASEDKNDSLVLGYYKSELKLNELLVLCFSHDNESAHHWKVIFIRSRLCMCSVLSKADDGYAEF